MAADSQQSDLLQGTLDVLIVKVVALNDGACGIRQRLEPAATGVLAGLRGSAPVLRCDATGSAGRDAELCKPSVDDGRRVGYLPRNDRDRKRLETRRDPVMD